MARSWLKLFLVLLIAMGVAFCAAPWFAFRALRSAAQAEDYQALDELIDYNAVRQGLRRQADSIQAPPPDFWSHPLAAMNRAIAPLKPAPALDALMTPAALAAMADGTPATAAQHGALPQLSDLVPGLHGRTIRYWDSNRCRIAVKAPNGGESLFSFERHGLFAWKLTQLKPPSAVN